MSDNIPVFDQRIRGDQPSGPSVPSQLDGTLPGEPEKLVLPPEAVTDLLTIAVQTREGNLWWRGWITAHGLPTWVSQGRWRIIAKGGADVVRAGEQ